MKTRQLWRFTILLTLWAAAPSGFAQISAFTYQGRLNVGGAPANGLYDFNFRLLNDPSNGVAAPVIPINLAVPVTNGLFTTGLDFGAENFDGANLWLEINVRTNGGGAFTTLSPRQLLTSTPYAVRALNASNLLGTLPASQISGAILNASLPASPSFAGTVGANSFSGDGANVTNVNAATLGGLSSSNFWQLGGNAGTTSNNFLGTTDDQPFELKVNGQRAMRLEPTGDSHDAGSSPDGTVNVILGSQSNSVAPGVVGATISGGGAARYDGYFSRNQVNADYATIGGGAEHTIFSNAPFSTIPGGYYNRVKGYAATISGGYDNEIREKNHYSLIAGGRDNIILTDSIASVIGGGTANGIHNSHFGTIGGGHANSITDFGPICTNNACGSYSTIGGGYGNSVIGKNATIPGGRENSATNFAFAAGNRAKADHTGAFVWGDSTDADINSTNADSVTMRASGGYRLFSDPDATAGVFVAPGGTSWAVISDRAVKKDFAPVDSRAILEKLAALPITQWHYRWEEKDVTPHLGPMAQDFKAAFYPGADDKSITTQEADGVALAAIQGLNQKLEEQRAENAELKQRLEKLEQLMNLKAK